MPQNGGGSVMGSWLQPQEQKLDWADAYAKGDQAEIHNQDSIRDYNAKLAQIQMEREKSKSAKTENDWAKRKYFFEYLNSAIQAPPAIRKVHLAAFDTLWAQTLGGSPDPSLKETIKALPQGTYVPSSEDLERLKEHPELMGDFWNKMEAVRTAKNPYDQFKLLEGITKPIMEARKRADNNSSKERQAQLMAGSRERVAGTNAQARIQSTDRTARAREYSADQGVAGKQYAADRGFEGKKYTADNQLQGHIVDGGTKREVEGMRQDGANIRNSANNNTRRYTVDTQQAGANSRNTETVQGRLQGIDAQQAGASSRNDATNATRVQTTGMQQQGANQRNTETVQGRVTTTGMQQDGANYRTGETNASRERQVDAQQLGANFRNGQTVDGRVKTTGMQQDGANHRNYETNRAATDRVRMQVEGAGARNDKTNQTHLDQEEMRQTGAGARTHETNETRLQTTGMNNAQSEKNKYIDAGTRRYVVDHQQDGANSRNDATNATRVQTTGMQQEGANYRTDSTNETKEGIADGNNAAAFARIVQAGKDRLANTGLANQGKLDNTHATGSEKRETVGVQGAVNLERDGANNDAKMDRLHAQGDEKRLTDSEQMANNVVRDGANNSAKKDIAELHEKGATERNDASNETKLKIQNLKNEAQKRGTTPQMMSYLGKLEENLTDPKALESLWGANGPEAQAKAIQQARVAKGQAKATDRQIKVNNDSRADQRIEDQEQVHTDLEKYRRKQVGVAYQKLAQAGVRLNQRERGILDKADQEVQNNPVIRDAKKTIGQAKRGLDLAATGHLHWIEASEVAMDTLRVLSGGGVVTDTKMVEFNQKFLQRELDRWMNMWKGHEDDEVPPEQVKVIKDRLQRVYKSLVDFHDKETLAQYQAKAKTKIINPHAAKTLWEVHKVGAGNDWQPAQKLQESEVGKTPSFERSTQVQQKPAQAKGMDGKDLKFSTDDLMRSIRQKLQVRPQDRPRLMEIWKRMSNGTPWPGDN